MKDARVALREVEVRGIKKGVGATLLKYRPASRGFHGHYVAVGCWRFLGDAQLPGVDAARLAIFADIFACGVVAHESYRGNRERRLESRQINEHVVGSAAIARRLGEDICKRVLRRVNVDDLGAIENKIPARQNSVARGARHV